MVSQMIPQCQINLKSKSSTLRNFSEIFVSNFYKILICKYEWREFCIAVDSILYIFSQFLDLKSIQTLITYQIVSTQY